MKLRMFAPLLLGAVLTASAADAAAIFTQNFSTSLGANETVSGRFSMANGQMGHAEGYRNNEYSYYQLALDLTGFTDAMMQFDFSIDSELDFDGFNVLASTDTVFNAKTELLLPQDPTFYKKVRGGFVRLGDYAVSGKVGATPTFDLSQFAGQTVNLRFQFQSDGFAFKPGVRLDNLKITGSPVGGGIIPEPSTWALMIGGFGLAGAALRRSRLAGVRVG